MLNNLTGWHAVIIIAVVLLVFGSAKLPALARSAGQSVRILRSEVREGRRESQAETDAASEPTGETPGDPARSDTA